MRFLSIGVSEPRVEKEELSLRFFSRSHVEEKDVYVYIIHTSG